MNTRHKAQSMGIILAESLLLDHSKIDYAINDLHNEGFGIVRVLMRNTNFNHRSPEAIAAVKRMTELCHKLGMKIVLDCEPHEEPVVRDLGNLFPEAKSVQLKRASAKLVDGNFVFHIQIPAPAGSRTEFIGVEAAFLNTGNGWKKIDSIKYDLNNEGEIYETGYTTKEHYYVEGRPADRRMHSHLIGKLEGVTDGELVVYAKFAELRLVDFWSEGCKKYFDLLLECYRDVPLDGVGWDEPGVGGDWNQYIYGEGFAKAFEKRNGYKLADRLYLLDESGTTPESSRVRLDYYETLNEGLYQAQKNLFDKARELFGQDLLFGTHHTWQGEGNINDYRAADVDYFRLNDNMDAGYTDCCWWDPYSVCYSYTLGSSLGRLTPSGEAEVNTWHWKPTNSLTEYNARLMSLYDITWFNIFYGPCVLTPCRYPEHYTWKTCTHEMRLHEKRQHVIGKAKPVVDIAIWHGWEGVTGINRAEIAAAHKAFSLNTSLLFVERNVAFDWVDSRLIASATVTQDKKLQCQLGSYSVLVLPYAAILPRNVWEVIRKFTSAGGKVIFVGTPVDLDLKGGILRDEFADLLGMPSLSLNKYLKGIDAQCSLPRNRPQKLEISYPLSGDAKRLLTSIENEAHGIVSKDGHVVYLTDLDPRERLLDEVGKFVSQRISCHSDSILWRLYRDDKRNVLVVVSRKERVLEGVVNFAGKGFVFSGGVAAILIESEGKVTVEGDGVKYREIPAV